MPKYKERRFNEDGRPIRNSNYTDNRECYMNENGDYVYTTQVRENEKWVTKTLATIPFEEMCGDTSWTIVLDDDDCQDDRDEDKQRKIIDPLMQARIAGYNAEKVDEDSSDLRDPMEEVYYRQQGDGGIFEQLFTEDKPEDPIVAKVEEIMSMLTEDQRNLIYDHIGMGKKLEDIRREDEERTGVKKTQQSYSNRWKKICQRFSKELGIPLPKKRKTKDTDAEE